MEAQFWINAWNEGRTNFHKEEFHDKLIQFYPELNVKAGQKVLVPLCGKSKDLLWLHDQGLNVHGLELYQNAVEAFFSENSLEGYNKFQDKDFIQYRYKNIVINCGDFFKLKARNEYDLIYDRASLVALPSEMRKMYAQIVTDALKVGGKYLLIVYEYDQKKLDGPPFSVDADEVHKLYGDNFSIQLKESERPIKENLKLVQHDHFKQTVYILEKKEN